MYKIETVSTEIPQDLQVRHLSGTVYEFIGHEDIVETTQNDIDGNPQTIYKSTMTHITTNVNSRDDMIVALIRLRYTQDAEFALINKGIADSNNAEYTAYRDYVATCKTQAGIYYEEA